MTDPDAGVVSRRVVPAPSGSYFALEPWSMLEYNAFATAMPFVRHLRQGQGQPVLVLPGFGGSDQSTLPLRRVLQRQGFFVHGWHLGPNTGPHPHIVDGLDRRLGELVEQHQGPVNLIGWSLGGVYARELARRQPGSVRQVITLGTPFRLRAGDRSNASWLYEMIGPRQEPVQDDDIGEEERPPLIMPTTSVYTRTDGIVSWYACLESAGEQRENIEVYGTHSGLCTNIAAVIAITDRLVQPDGGWLPFRPPRSLRHLFRKPAHWRPPAHQPALLP